VPKHWRERAFDSPREELLEQWARCSDAINRRESLDEIYAAPSVAADLTPFFTPSIFFYLFLSPSVSRRFGEAQATWARVAKPCTGPGGRAAEGRRICAHRESVDVAPVRSGSMIHDRRERMLHRSIWDRRFLIGESGCGTGPFVTNGS
jgi:hypothetical protein